MLSIRVWRIEHEPFEVIELDSLTLYPLELVWSPCRMSSEAKHILVRGRRFRFNLFAARAHTR